MKNVKKVIIAMVVTLAVMAPVVAMLEATTITANAASVKLSKKKLTLRVGDSSKLALKNYKKKVIWSSSNKKIVKVNKSGRVVAMGAGSARITVKAGKKKYTCKVKVDFKNIALTTGKKTIIKITGVSKSKVKWSSSNKSIATVSKGKITAKKAGSATITAKVGRTSYKAKVTVKAKQPEWKSHFRIDYMIDTADGVLMKATNISSKTINKVAGYVDYKDALGYKIDYDLAVVEGIAPKESFYMTFKYPHEKSYSSWAYRFEINGTSLVFTSRNSSLTAVDPWFDINSWYWKSGVTVRNSGSRDLFFDLIAIYKYKGKIVGFGEKVLCRIRAGSAEDYKVEGSCASEYDSVEIFVNDCATYR